MTAATPHKVLLQMAGSTSLAPYGFSTDGTKVLYTYPSTESGGTDDIGVLSMQTKAEPDSLITGDFNEWCPSFSPDGRHIAFTSTRAPHRGNKKLYIMNTNGKNQHRIL